MIDRRLVQVDDQPRDLARVDALAFAPSARIAPHAEELRAKPRGHRPLQGYPKGLLLARRQPDLAGKPVLGRIGIRIVNPQINVHGPGAQVLHIHGDVVKRREIPMSLGRAEPDARPTDTVARGNAQRRAV
ncbi:MAG: hypothetical protein A2V70_20300 [Planctomycetes bacterium RBG_13_63_9]|nr:MAG: hypothetical protein A2V70_20300 [Planctomycetes bacterium RBG_13_63_9]